MLGLIFHRQIFPITKLSGTILNRDTLHMMNLIDRELMSDIKIYMTLKMYNRRHK